MTNQAQQDIKDDEIDLIDLFFTLWANKIKIISFSLIISLIAIIYSLSLPNIYQSNAILSSSKTSGNNISNIASQYSGVASLAGISLPAGQEGDDVAKAVEIMKSLAFFSNLAEKENIFFELQASKGWNSSNNELIIDPEKYDFKTNKWVSDQAFAQDGKPSLQSAHRDFLYNFDVSIDLKTRFVTISYRHYSPYIAKKVLDIVILEINSISRAEDIKIAEDSIKFLTDEASKTNFTEVKLGINNIIQKQIQTITLANASPDYLLEVLSEPSVPEVKFLPDRKFIVILSFIFGLLFSISFVLFNKFIVAKSSD